MKTMGTPPKKSTKKKVKNTKVEKLARFRKYLPIRTKRIVSDLKLIYALSSKNHVIDWELYEQNINKIEKNLNMVKMQFEIIRTME